jgi:hypothetical protein
MSVTSEIILERKRDEEQGKGAEGEEEYYRYR